MKRTEKAVVRAAREKLRAHILSERDIGNIVFHGLPGQLMGAELDQFVEQPVDGILYDLNRSEEISLKFLNDPKWVNDFAVALVIRKLVEQRDKARHASAGKRKGKR